MSSPAERVQLEQERRDIEFRAAIAEARESDFAFVRISQRRYQVLKVKHRSTVNAGLGVIEYEPISPPEPYGEAMNRFIGWRQAEKGVAPISR